MSGYENVTEKPSDERFRLVKGGKRDKKEMLLNWVYSGEMLR